MNSSVRDAIAEITTNILTHFYGESPTFPLNIEDLIVNKLGGQITPDHSLDMSIDAQIDKVDGSFNIRINPNLADTRKNFTLAHELGHLFLHMGFMMGDGRWENADTYIDGAFSRDAFNKSEEENQAHEFAGALLMPATEYRKTVQELINNNSVNVLNLASKFGVSYDAALIRGKWLGVFAW